MSLLARTPYLVICIVLAIKCSGIRICFEPQIRNRCTSEQANVTVPLECSYCKGAFDLMGWEKLAPLVLL
jgi:hypothetical protein